MLTVLQCTVLAVSMQVGHPDMRESLSALALVESSLGARMIGDDGESLGPWQMKIGTAQEVLQSRPWLRRGRVTDAQVRSGLLTDARWAARLARAHLKDLISEHGWVNGHRAYRAGETGMRMGRAKERPDAIRNAMKELKRLRRTCR